MTTYQVTGMTCEHCVAAVRSEITGIAGVTGVEIDLVAGGTSTVTVDGQATDEQIAQAVDEAGYALARPGDLPLA
ncbi:MAG: heavy-metal-associated domain-containing protein [Actinomycetota bacterium]|nr:heavy-metal-associated domain-containing protein [Actinomycetota bacterium]